MLEASSYCEIDAEIVLCRLTDRRDYIVEQCGGGRNGRRYHFGNETYPFCWNIKLGGDAFMLHDGDMLRRRHPDMNLQPRFDRKWVGWLAGHEDHYFNLFCEDALRQFIDSWTPYYDDGQQHQWRFGTVGRSGGWLTLLDYDQVSLTRLHPSELPDALHEMDYSALTSLWVSLLTVDLETKDPDALYLYSAADYRANLEQEWRKRRTHANQYAAAAHVEARGKKARRGFVSPGRAKVSHQASQ